MTLPDKKQFRKIIKTGLPYIGGVLAVAFISYFFIIRPLAIHNEKRNFAQAEKSLDTLQQQIIAKIGKPDQESTLHSCNRQSRVYEQGALGCLVSRSLLYENEDSTSSTKLLHTVASLYPGRPLNFLGDTFTAYKPISEHRGEQYPDQELADIGKLHCGIQYNYPATYKSSSPFNPKYPENFQITMYCSGSALRAYYTEK